jgi:dynamin-binding protein
VQRLLKYSLLLNAIIEETPDAHPDKPNLKEARLKMEEVAHGVNEGRRRREVVKDVLMGGTTKKTGETKAKKGLNVNLAASVSLGRMKSLRAGPFKAKEGTEANQEAEEVSRMGEELKACEVFIRKFAKDAEKWSKSLTEMVDALRKWTVSFGQVIGVSGEVQSEAFDAFLTVIQYRILPVCEKLDGVLHNQLHNQLARLVDSMVAPARLLEAMRTLEPLHYGLLNLNLSKSRPPPQLLEASQSYVALRAQLFAELPKYLELLHRGIVAAIMQFAAWQAEFWEAVRDKWAELWDALKVEGEMQGEAIETLKVWWSRFANVESSVAGLNIVRAPPDKKDRDRDKSAFASSSTSTLRPGGRARGKSFSDSPYDNVVTTSTTSTVVMSTLAALDPTYMPHRASVSSQTLVASPTSTKSRNLEKKTSNESLRSKHSGKSTKSSKSRPSHKYTNSNTSYQYPSHGYDHADGEHGEPYHPSPKPGYHRTASMPISLPMPLRRSSSQGRLLDASSERPHVPTPEHPADHYEEETVVRGRMTRKPTMKRRITDTLENFRPTTPTSTSTSRHRRSPSLPPMKQLNIATPEPSPRQAHFGVQRSVASIPCMYECRVVHPCYPPPNARYKELPFFTLEVGNIFAVIQEHGHPSTHRGLPLVLDDGEDCLLLTRSRQGDLGWALASFLLPVD